jgi:hypothetical protein
MLTWVFYRLNRGMVLKNFIFFIFLRVVFRLSFILKYKRYLLLFRNHYRYNTVANKDLKKNMVVNGTRKKFKKYSIIFNDDFILLQKFIWFRQINFLNTSVNDLVFDKRFDQIRYNFLNKKKLMFFMEDLKENFLGKSYV